MSEFKVATYRYEAFEFLPASFTSERDAQSFVDGVCWASSILDRGDDDIVMAWVLPGSESEMRREIADYCTGDEEENIEKAEKAFGIQLREVG